jgi:hypothetical protein
MPTSALRRADALSQSLEVKRASIAKSSQMLFTNLWNGLAIFLHQVDQPEQASSRAGALAAIAVFANVG